MVYIADETIEQVAQYINQRNNHNYQISIIGDPQNAETPQVFEIVDFANIDNTNRNFFAIDGSYNSQEFFNGVTVGAYSAGYICYHHGNQVRLNNTDDPLLLGQKYYPKNILVTNQSHLNAIYEELINLEPVKNFLNFVKDSEPLDQVFGFPKESILKTMSSLLSFCQEILEWSLVYEIATLDRTRKDDFILFDGDLRSTYIKQKYIVKLGKFIHSKGIILVGVTKNSPIKIELSYTFKQIDSYLQGIKPSYPFSIAEPDRQKLCCWFEVPETVLARSYGGERMTNIDFARKSITSGAGVGLFCVARLDYVEKLQNYDWLVVDTNIFDAIPNIEKKDNTRDIEKMNLIFSELTRLTQEHYILGYPYPLVEVHNFVTLQKAFKEELVNRIKSALYHKQLLDNVDIENLFLDTHERF